MWMGRAFQREGAATEKALSPKGPALGPGGMSVCASGPEATGWGVAGEGGASLFRAL